MSAHRALVGALVLSVALLSGCTSNDVADLPDGPGLLGKSADAIGTVKTTHFAVTVDGQLPDITVQGAEGDLTSDGDAQGKAKVNQLGQLLEVDFVLVGGDLYLKGPTGGFQKLPAALKGQVYDPSTLLNPDTGVAKVLRGVRDAKTESSDDRVYVVAGTVPKDIAAGLAPGVGSDVAGKFSITKDSSKLVSARFELTGKDGKPASVEVELSDFDKPVTVSPPA